MFKSLMLLLFLDNMDERLLKHAQILVDHSTKVQPGDMVLIRYTDYGLGLAKAVYETVAKRSAIPTIVKVPTESFRALYDYTPEEYLAKTPSIDLAAFKAMDVLISIRGEDNLKSLKSVDKKKISIRNKATKPLLDEYMGKRWVLTQAPDAISYAQEAEMSSREYEDFVFKSVIHDWTNERTKLQKISDTMDKTSQVTIRGVDTDLTFSIKGRKSVIDDGEHNMPGGEVFTAPVEDSAEGKVYFDLPSILFGNEARDVALKFSRGEVVDYKAGKGEDFLKAMLETDDNITEKWSRRLGELGIGTNYGITQFTRNILFDEKIGGTIHLALGKSYPHCLGKNMSSIHWDMIKNMKGGELIFDDVVVQKDGAFVQDILG